MILFEVKKGIITEYVGIPYESFRRASDDCILLLIVILRFSIFKEAILYGTSEN